MKKKTEKIRQQAVNSLLILGTLEALDGDPEDPATIRRYDKMRREQAEIAVTNIATYVIALLS